MPFLWATCFLTAPHTDKATPHTPHNSTRDLQTCNETTSPKTANPALQETDEILLSMG